MKNIADIRKNYIQSSLDITEVSDNPIVQFEAWFQEALEAEALEVNSMCLSTVSESGIPSGRIVLLKGIEDGQFVFFTNYQSRKGTHMAANPAVSLTFFWAELERQVRIEGTVEKTSSEQSDRYFQSRPKGSQIGAWASPQSAAISNRKVLEERVEQIEAKYGKQDVLPRPQQWGGYAVKPEVIEFWQGRSNRLHDRLFYSRKADGWQINRLAP